MSEQVEYPEHEKLSKTQVERQAVGDFIEWLNSKGYAIAKSHIHSRACRGGNPFGPTVCGFYADELQPVHRATEGLIADHFGIDADKLDAEKRDMLAKIRMVQVQS